MNQLNYEISPPFPCLSLSHSVFLPESTLLTLEVQQSETDVYVYQVYQGWS